MNVVMYQPKWWWEKQMYLGRCYVEVGSPTIPWSNHQLECPSNLILPGQEFTVTAFFNLPPNITLKVRFEFVCEGKRQVKEAYTVRMPLFRGFNAKAVAKFVMPREAVPGRSYPVEARVVQIIGK